MKTADYVVVDMDDVDAADVDVAEKCKVVHPVVPAPQKWQATEGSFPQTNTTTERSIPVGKLHYLLNIHR